MNILHMKYAYEVAKAGSLGKAAEVLLIAAPNLSRSIKELEAELGITIFDRTSKGMILTSDGEEFMSYAKSILGQITQLEKAYKDRIPTKKKFSVSVPRTCYISNAFASFSKNITDSTVEVFYQETNSQHIINNILNKDYKLGVIRYAADDDKYFKSMFEEKGLNYELIAEFNYRVLTSANSPFSQKDSITAQDLESLIEISYADTFVPSVAPAQTFKEEITGKSERRIFLFERASRFDLLKQNPDTFMWESPVPDDILESNNLVQLICQDNRKEYKDVLIYKEDYTLTDLDNRFITRLCDSRRKIFLK